MNIIVVIQGREAIPVRAVAFAANWGMLTPDHLASVLARRDEIEATFDGLAAHRIEDGRALPIRANWWEGNISWKLVALDERLRAQEAAGALTAEEGYERWREGSTLTLPSNAFIWKDELESRHLARGSARYGEAGMPKSVVEEHARTALDFDPFVEPQFRALIAEAIAILQTPHEARSETSASAGNEQASAGASVRVVTAKGVRNDVLAPVIRKAMAQCSDPFDSAEVWSKLHEMARAKEPPFLGGITDAGLQYEVGEEPRYLSRGKLRDRLRRAKAR